MDFSDFKSNVNAERIIMEVRMDGVDSLMRQLAIEIGKAHFEEIEWGDHNDMEMINEDGPIAGRTLRVVFPIVGKNPE